MSHDLPIARRTLLPLHHHSYHHTITAQSSVAKSASRNAQPISGRVDRASATEAVDTGSIPGRVKPKTIKIGTTDSLLDV